MGIKSKKKPRPTWMTEKRNWVVYAMQPEAQSLSALKRYVIPFKVKQHKRVCLYVGMTSRSLATRRTEHEGRAAAGSMCPLYVEMRRAPIRQWHILRMAMQHVRYDDAKKLEEIIKAKMRANPGIYLLNRSTKKCADER
jgi:hypothetical protein